MKTNKFKLLIITLLGFAILTQTSCKKEEQVVESTQNQTTTPTTQTDDDNIITGGPEFVCINICDSVYKHLDSIVFSNELGDRKVIKRDEIIDEFIPTTTYADYDYLLSNYIFPVTSNEIKRTCKVYASVNETGAGNGYFGQYCCIQIHEEGQVCDNPWDSDFSWWAEYTYQFSGSFSFTN
jgi:hypothetical protein